MDKSAVFNEELEEKDKRKVVDLKLIAGGKEPPLQTGNWLRDTEIGTVFAVQNKLDRGDFHTPLFRLMAKEGPNAKVVAIMGEDDARPRRVDPYRFCNRFDKFFDYGILLMKEEVTNEHNREPSSPAEKEEDMERST